MKKWMWALIIIGILIIGWLFVRFVIRGNEDSWIRDEKGEYTEHGAPSKVPDYVKEQQTAIIQARELYAKKRTEGMQFSSQCLGVVGNNVKYAVDIVHVPRTAEDNLVENQCEDYRSGLVEHFIELDKEGNIFRIV